MRRALNIFKALSDETRLKIVRFLLSGEKCVCEIVAHTGKAQSTVSLQLKKLKELGIVKSRREGKRIIYWISNRDVIEILNKLKDNAKCPNEE